MCLSFKERFWIQDSQMSSWKLLCKILVLFWWQFIYFMHFLVVINITSKANLFEMAMISTAMHILKTNSCETRRIKKKLSYIKTEYRKIKRMFLWYNEHPGTFGGLMGQDKLVTWTELTKLSNKIILKIVILFTLKM